MSLTRKALVAAAGVALWLWPMGTARAQDVSSFAVTVLKSTMTFKVSTNGGAYNAVNSTDVNLYSAMNGTTTSSLEVGFARPPGNTIDLLYHNTSGGTQAVLGANVADGDYALLKVFGIGGVYLTDVNGVTGTTPGSTIKPWLATDGGVATSLPAWSAASANANYIGYEAVPPWDATQNWLAYKPFANYDGKDWTANEKGQYGDFSFDGLTLGASAAYLGMDVIADVYASTATGTQGSLLGTAGVGNTGRVKITSFDEGGGGGGDVVPEASAFLLIGFGGLPLALAAVGTRKRR